jgi:TorA maturation chaperone TorD
LPQGARKANLVWSVISTAESAEAASRRSVLYWTLSELLLTCPDVGFVERLRQVLDLKSPSKYSNRVTKHLKAMRRALPQDVSGVEKLGVEYTRALGAVSPSYGLPAPYESVHRQSDSPAEVRAAVGRFYLDAGLIPGSAAPADHIGVELKFLSLLCHNEAEAWKAREGDHAAQMQTRESNFINTHLVHWAPDYLSMLRSQSEHPLYKAAALLALEMITEHSETASTPLNFCCTA